MGLNEMQQIGRLHSDLVELYKAGLAANQAPDKGVDIG